MEEILFRGQTRRKGEKCRLDGTPVESNWVYGGVLQGKGDHSIIYQTEPDIEKKVVYTDTLGQYIGLVDKDGTKIFEGDAVFLFDKADTGIVAWDAASAKFVLKIAGQLLDFSNYSADNAAVITNIYDNPEYIKED